LSEISEITNPKVPAAMNAKFSSESNLMLSGSPPESSNYPIGSTKFPIFQIIRIFNPPLPSPEYKY